ncbi:Hypothetical protein mma_0960 [Janthinobacterium sp. Marseille]|nr:diguanylate cyclase [Janthinobacterium sp. Marseille]ABR91700.1 Hypothetical protein mma_0960 [Janthinobacterium sp. Marseille]
MKRPIILHCNVTIATLNAIQATFGATYRLIQIDAMKEIALKEKKERVVMAVIGVGNELTGLPKNLTVPTVLIARHPNTKQELQALEAGAVDYLSDAMQMSVLTARLRSHLSGRMSELECYIRELELQQRKSVKLNRSLATLNRTKSAIVRLSERSVLFNEVVRVAVEDGGYGIAWIALRDKTERFAIVASSGFSNDEFLGINALLARDDAIKNRVNSAVVDICNTTSLDTVTDPYSIDAYNRGFGALALVPIKLENQVEGVMALYAAEEEFFDDSDISLLSELSQDLSFALRNFEQQGQANYLSCYDVLTGLPNCSLFLEKLNQIIYMASSREVGAYVLVLELEHFKNVNEVLGRQAGDQVLEIIAQRLRASLPEQTSVARIAGDTFAIADLYPDNTDLTLLINRITTIIENPIQLEGHTLQLSAYLGFARSPEDGEGSKVVFHNAEAALKHAKLTGERTSFYSSELNAHVSDKLKLEVLMRSAIGTNQFVMHYQPKVDVWSYQDLVDRSSIRPVTKGGDHVQNQGLQQGKASI